MTKPSFKNFSLFLLIYTVVIILWGAFVRFSGSGDGCGKHWPLCQGYWVPEGDVAAVLQTWIEYAHRMKSGLLGILIGLQWIWSFRAFPAKHPARRSATAAFVFMIIEAGLGAWLVLRGLVDRNESPERILTIGLHFINTIFLLASLTLTWAWSQQVQSFRLQWSRAAKLAAAMALSFVVLGILGSIASLSNTLYPSSDLFSGLREDLSSSGPWLQRMRFLHPTFAVLIGAFFLVGFFKIKEWGVSLPPYLRLFPGLIVVGVLFGFATLISLSPIWMKLVHLCLADLIWISLVLILASTLAPQSLQSKRQGLF